MVIVINETVNFCVHVHVWEIESRVWFCSRIALIEILKKS